MTHRIKPGDRYKFDPTGPTYENTLPHDIFVDRKPIFVGGTFGLCLGDGARMNPLELKLDPIDFLIRVAEQADARIPVLMPGSKLQTVSPFPAFVAPERPAEPEAPKPTPDTPAVATLKALLADRQGEVFSRRLTVMSVTEEVVRLEEELARERKDLAHAETVLAAAETEVNAIVADIEKLGGTVEAQS